MSLIPHIFQEVIIRQRGQREMKKWVNSPRKSTAIAYMLAGDGPDGGASKIDPAAAQPATDNEWGAMREFG
jgi:hypothetical protein